MNPPCNLCRQELDRPGAASCARCGAFQDLDRRAQERRLLLLDSVDTGLREAVRRTRACPHGCPTTSLGLLLPGRLRYQSAMARCVYTWFAMEYPPSEELAHEVFHYPC